MDLPSAVKIPSKTLAAYLALGTGAVSLSFAALFVRWAQAPGVVTGFYRLFLSTLFLLPFVLRPKAGKRAILWTDIVPPILGGACMAINFALWNTSVFYTNVSNAAMLGNITPLWVSIFAWLLMHERLKKQFWAGLLTIVVGMSLIVGGDFFIHPHLGFGDLLATGSSLFSAAYILITQWGRKNLNALTYTWINGASASVWMLVIIRLFRSPLTGFPAQTWMVFIAAAILIQITGYVAISFALGSLPASIVSPTLNLQPAIATLLAIPFLQEIPTLVQILGCLFALGGVYLINSSYQR